MPAQPTRTSGDPVADRRHAWGEASLREGDASAAAELFAQAVEAAPGWAAGWFSLGDAHERAGDGAAAIPAFRRARALDAADQLGAGVRLARLGAGGTMSSAYVASLFDEYAERFDAHLVAALAYRGPEIVAEAIAGVCRAAGRALRFRQALDIGCGTGLMAREMAPHVGAMTGVDLSPRMIAKAAATGLYADGGLVVGDALAHMERQPAASHDLLMAADVLVYVADLGPLFAGAARLMARDALFAFTVQTHAGDGVVLGDDLRHHHGEAHVRVRAAACGLAVAHLSPCVTRKDAGRNVPGLVVVLMRAHA
jgi:predicted TPR repeat methyltransferase